MSLIYLAGHSDALEYAASNLARSGFRFTPCPGPDVTHLLLPVPSMDPDGSIKGGGDLQEILSQLPDSITVVGGNLPSLPGYQVWDLLQDPMYLAKNANITAHCAISLAMAQLKVTLEECPVLIIGWGRIGKCLAHLLRGLNVQVTVAARKEIDRATAASLGFDTIDIPYIATERFRVIFNTAPEMLLPVCSGNNLKIDLASRRGIGGDDVIWARGLPGKDAPESSGALIAQTILRKGILQ